MKIKVGVVGLGYWGPNYIRNFIRNGAQVSWACDLSEKAFLQVSQTYPRINFTKKFEDLLSNKNINCIAIATPPETHYELTKRALDAGKHVLVAKPLTKSSKSAEELVKIAKSKKLLLHCDLTYLYSGGIRTIRKLLTSGQIGEPLYFDSTRTNLGLIQNNTNVIWDLAIHDLSILKFCFELKPTKITAIGSKHHKNSKTEEMAHVTLHYPNDFIAHIHVSWLSPVKIRTILIGGSEKMLLFDDVQPDEKIKIYDKGVILPSESISPFKPIYRTGNIVLPKIDNEEPLFLEISDFIGQLMNRKINYQNAIFNVDIIRLLEACDESLKKSRSVTL